MKDFVYNSALGKMFFAEFGNFVHSSCINGKSDFYEDVFMIVLEEYLSLSTDEIKQLITIAYRYDLTVEFRAESNSLIVEFCRC